MSMILNRLSAGSDRLRPLDKTVEYVIALPLNDLPEITAMSLIAGIARHFSNTFGLFPGNAQISLRHNS